MRPPHEPIPASELMHITVPAAILLFLSLAALAFWLWVRKEEGLKALAKATGLTYFRDGKSSMALPSHSALHGARMYGLDLAFADVLEGTYHGTDIAVFRLVRYSGSGPEQRQHGYAYLVCSLAIPDIIWPSFTVRPKRWLDIFRKGTRPAKPMISSCPRFLENYVVSSDSEEMLQALFTREVCEWCLRHPGLIVEGEGSALVLYRRPSMLKWNATRPRKVERMYRMGCEFVDTVRPPQ